MAESGPAMTNGTYETLPSEPEILVHALDRAIEIRNAAYTYVGAPILVLGTLGNLLTIIVLLYAKSFRTMSFGVLLILLAVTDIGVLNTVLLRYVLASVTDASSRFRWWHHSDGGCRTQEFLQRFFVYLSPWTLVLITGERLLSVLYPFRSSSLIGSRKWAIIAWLSLCAVDTFINLYHPIRGWFLYTLCRPQDVQADQVIRIYELVDLFASSLLPGLVILIMNVQIIRFIRRSRRSVDQLMTSSVPPKSRGNTVMLIIVSILFLCLSLPVNIALNIFNFLKPDTRLDNVFKLEIMIDLARLLSVLVNNGCNFIIYCMMGRKFRTQLGLLFCGRSIPNSTRAALSNLPHTRLNSRSKSRSYANEAQL